MAASTVEALRTVQKAARELCASCLSDEIADNAAILDDLIEVAENMVAIRHLSPDNEQLCLAALGELMTAVMVIAVFTGELSHRPVLFEAKASLN